MKTYFILSKITVDEKNPNHVSKNTCILTIADALATPDNKHFGIIDIVVHDALSGKTLDEIEQELRKP